ASPPATPCTDVNGTTGISQADFKGYITELETESAFFSGIFAQVRMKCMDWQLRPTWGFDGPFAAPGGTAFPLLLVGATRDPVTPIEKYMYYRLSRLNMWLYFLFYTF
ncbi:MAG: hypothetical protein Q9210_004679, partial [Variospora velana]